MTKVRCVQAANALVGEGPTWDGSRQRLLWLDTRRPALYAFSPDAGQTDQWPLPPERASCVLPTTDGRFVVAGMRGIELLDLQTGELQSIANPEGRGSGNRLNDGKVDRAGRLWVGSVHSEFVAPSGSLYRMDPDLSVHRMDTGFVCSNGIGWSPDDRTMYFVDSMIGAIFAYEFDLTTGELGQRRTFAHLREEEGAPDGLTVDAEGHVWVAIWDGWRINRYAPDGAIVDEIAMPVPRPSSCMFGGPDLRTLFVTSASSGRDRLDRSALSRGPLSGGLFALEPGVAGLPEQFFAIQS